MATITKKGNDKSKNNNNKSFGYTIGDKFDLYKMAGIKRPHKEVSNNKNKKENP